VDKEKTTNCLVKQGTIYYIKLRALEGQTNVDERPTSMLGTVPWTSTFAHQFYNQTLYDVLHAYGVYSTVYALSKYFPDKINDVNVPELENSIKDKFSKLPKFAQSFKLQSDLETLTQQIQKTPDNALFLSARSGAYLNQKSYQLALNDAEASLKIEPLIKTYLRKGESLEGLKRFDEARETYQTALEIEPSNSSLQDHLEKVTLILYSKLKDEVENLRMGINQNAKQQQQQQQQQPQQLKKKKIKSR